MPAARYLLICHLTTSLVASGYSLTISQFSKEPICNVQERIANECSREQVTTVNNNNNNNTNNVFQCLAQCGRLIECVGASVEKSTGKCFVHETCSPSSPCLNPDTDHVYYSRYCVHGYWNVTTQACACVMGTFGERCDKANRTCAGDPPGKRHIYVDPKQDGDLYPVHCRIIGNGVSAISVLRNIGGKSFNQTWRKYLKGFNPPFRSTYWIGLNAWQALNSHAACRNLTLSLIFKKPDYKLYRLYKGFVMEKKEDKFSFTYRRTFENTNRNPAGNDTFGNCLGNLQNISFSTWDSGSPDDVIGNCAARVGHGWWHPDSCNSSCNLMGRGLNDWVNTPHLQRFSVLGVDMAEAAPNVSFMSINMRCDLNGL